MSPDTLSTAATPYLAAARTPRNEDRPTLVISECLGFAAVRYNGEILQSRFVQDLVAHVYATPVCPEVALGLGVPRQPIRLVGSPGAARLINPEAGLDHSDSMASFAAAFLSALGPVDGFLLKSRSPSCGIGDVRIYHNAQGGGAQKGRGMFAEAVFAAYPDTAIDDEGRMNDYGLRTHFLTKLWAHWRWRRFAAGKPTIADLIEFHAREKLLLMVYSQKQMRALGRIVAGAKGRPIDDVLADYAHARNAAFRQRPAPKAHANALEHAFGYVSKRITAGERRHFTAMVRAFRQGRQPLETPLEMLRGYLLGHGITYLLQQTYFDPYPEPLHPVVKR